MTDCIHNTARHRGVRKSILRRPPPATLPERLSAGRFVFIFWHRFTNHYRTRMNRHHVRCPTRRSSACGREPSAVRTANIVARPAGRQSPWARRPGFTLVEIMIVTVILGILAGLANPVYRKMVVRAHAARVAGDFNVVRLAAYGYLADHNAWPPDVDRGVVPPGLVPYLPDGFRFAEEDYTIDWDNWSLPDGTPTQPATKVIVGISVVTADADLGTAVVDLLGDANTHYTIGEHYTFVLRGT